VESVKAAVAQFANGEIDLYATWGLEHMAVATPKGREQAAPFVSAFVKDVQGNGQLAQAQKDAGLRGAAKAEP
jgi:polar amino acid transport system substrate-binding protein